MKSTLAVITCVVLSMCLASEVNAEDFLYPVTLYDSERRIELAGHIASVRDDVGSLTIEDLISPPFSDQFEISDKSTFEQGLAHSVFWYRTQFMVSDESDAGEWVLEAGYPWVDYVDFYVFRHDGKIDHVLSGASRHASAKQLSHRNFAIPVRAEPGDSFTVYVRVEDASGHTFSLSAWEREAFQRKSSLENLGYGLFYGILLVMTLYNLMIFLWVRDDAYLYYVLYLISITVFSTILNGQAQQFGNAFFENAPTVINVGGGVFLFLMDLFALQFARRLLKLSEYLPSADSLMTGLVILSAIGACSAPFVALSIAVSSGFVVGITGFLIAFGASILLSLRGFRTAKFYLVAWSTFLIGASVAMLAGSGVLPANSVTMGAWKIGVCFDVVLLSLALAERINQERRDKFSARAEAIEQEQRVNRLKSFLPQKVADLVGAGDSSLLEPRRRMVAVCMIDLRGFTPFSETSAPEDVMLVLSEFYSSMGAVVDEFDGTVEHYAGDSMLILFNAPLDVAEPGKQAVLASLRMQYLFADLRENWAERGYVLGLGIGITEGYATTGAIGFLGRSQYTAIGTVTNLASRLCDQAGHGEILTTTRVASQVEALFEFESVGQQSIKGLSRPVEVMKVLGKHT